MSTIDPNTPLGQAEHAGSADTRPAAAGTPGQQAAAAAQADRDTVHIESLVRATASRLVVDAATRITQIEILDPATRQVLREFPDSDWLRIVRAARAMAAEAIVDKRT
ncbi:MAG: flagellar biosynthesis protein FlaG [Solidesulfovibrio sp. DCME]|uniref:flagellar biosynthesis protein FlaG n=1 Tax=Solidesulfovibrio sp. DCME TaxID=3447380 RepID=UPI003D0E89CB